MRTLRLMIGCTLGLVGSGFLLLGLVVLPDGHAERTLDEEWAMAQKGGR